MSARRFGVTRVQSIQMADFEIFHLRPVHHPTDLISADGRTGCGWIGGLEIPKIATEDKKKYPTLEIDQVSC